MRYLKRLLIVGCICLSAPGCLINMYNSDPVRRTNQLLVVSENLRQIQDEWERFWFLDQPSHLTYQRIHGGIGP